MRGNQATETEQFVRLQLTVRELDARIKEVQAQQEPFRPLVMAEALTHKTAGIPLRVLGHNVLWVEGNEALDQQTARALLQQHGISVPVKRGAPYVRVV